MNSAKIHALLAVVPILVALSNGSAFAQGGIPNCSDLPNPIYMIGTTAVEPLVRHFGAKLGKLSPPQTLLWNQNSDGCSAVASMAFKTVSTAIASTFNYYIEPEGQVDGGPTKITTLSCNALLDSVGDLVINDIFWTSCSGSYSNPSGPQGTLPAQFKEFLGPVQGLVPIVNRSYYYYNDIMAEELLDLCACGANGNILTFTKDSSIYDYNCNGSGMRELWANGLGVRGGSFTSRIGLGCNSTLSATSMLTTVAGGEIDTTIGYTSTEVYDENRDQVRALKVQGIEQNLAYLPDTDLSSRDKINIREGRYTIQAALKLVTQVNATGQPTNAAAKRMIDWLTDNPQQDPTLRLPFSIIDVYAQSGVVPQCAMKVTKATDAPVFQGFQPQNPCHCYFQVQATGATSIPGCVACQDSSTCTDGTTCSYGYCE
jgi:hypothetical protein